MSNQAPSNLVPFTLRPNVDDSIDICDINGNRILLVPAQADGKRLETLFAMLKAYARRQVKASTAATPPPADEPEDSRQERKARAQASREQKKASMQESMEEIKRNGQALWSQVLSVAEIFKD